MRNGFTLSEVLITLGIIGIVAALTLPSLISTHRKQVIERRLQKFYSNMLQVYKLSELDNEGAESWDYELSSQDFYDRYYKNYLKGATTIYHTDKRFVEVRFIDSTMMIIGYTNFINFYPKIPKNYYTGVRGNIVIENKTNKYGKDVFAFDISQKEECKFIPTGTSNCYASHVKTDNNALLNNCANPDKGTFCTEIIRRNNWKIPKNYPIKI